MPQYMYDHYQTITSRKFMAVKTWWHKVLIIKILSKIRFEYCFTNYIKRRFFILWYQILGHNAPDSVHAMFATLVPGFSSPIPEHPGLAALWSVPSNSVTLHDNLSSKANKWQIRSLLFENYLFYLNFLGPINAVETNLIYPPQIGEKQPDDIVKYYLESLLELMVNQVII